MKRRTGHLSGTVNEALPYFRQLLEKEHIAMLPADIETAVQPGASSYSRSSESTPRTVTRIASGLAALLPSAMIATSRSIRA